ncbi:hypothetical protein [Pedobacter paludis]|nr:hypothetical protein [Pedobacter paludis]
MCGYRLKWFRWDKAKMIMETKGKENAQEKTSGVETGQTGQGSSDEGNKEIRFELPIDEGKPSLEETLRKIRYLSRLSHQRDRLIVTIDQLAAFEVRQQDLLEELTVNQFQRCEIAIMDDRGERFATKNPFLVDAVAKNIMLLCGKKLAELEKLIAENL